eukprot:jgi/Botrbrau1/10571/Bobra.0343s0019.1
MAMAIPIVSQVGLQLLLEPAASPAVAKGACCIFGEALPLYRTYKSLQRREPRELVLLERSQWLYFWSIYSSLGILERVTDVGARFKGYYHVKLLFLLWLTSSRYRGATRLFKEVVAPFLDSASGNVDAVLDDCSAFVNRPEGKPFFNWLHEACTSLPLLKWFVRDPPPP